MASPLTRLVQRAVAQAELEHNPIAELVELQDSLMFQFNQVQMKIHVMRQTVEDEPGPR